ncbi:MAG: undecaprenyldiphospho-muramoylpentapeptide beta-N-acetylglucosaminyltransferase [Thermomicrobiales bacterium]
MSDPENGLRLVVAGGGTGGHVLPALAVIEELRRRQSLAAVLWIGSHEGVEVQAAADAGIQFVAIPTGKLRRYLSLRNLTDAARVPLGVVAAHRALRSFKPDVVLSTGGFVSVSTVLAARGIAPVLTHEQTAVLGLATRINARFADVLAVSHAQTESVARGIHRHVMVTGNPVRGELASGDRRRGLSFLDFDDTLPVTYVTGGARGASPINQRIAAMIPQFLESTQIVHQTGPASANADAAELTRRRDSLPEHLRRRYRLFEFVGEELPDIYAAADLVVARAGAGTIAELAFIGKPAILIPLPGTGGDEQTVNARVLGDIGAALVIPQHEASPERLHEELKSLLGDPGRRASMARAARTAARPEAASRLADALIALAGRRTSHMYQRRDQEPMTR